MIAKSTSQPFSVLLRCLLFINSFHKVSSTFFGGFGGGCSCGPPPVCPPEPVCAPPPVIVAAPPPPIAVPLAPVQVPTTYVGGCGGCGGFSGGDCMGYYSPYSCGGCRKNRRLGSQQWIKFRERRRRVKRHNFINSGGKRRKKSKKDPKCNSEKLKMIMKKAVGMKTSTLKRNIQLLVEKKMGAQYNVLCGQGEFSYTTTTDEYCQTKVMDRTCYVFKRMDNKEEEDENEERETTMVEDYDEI